ncbi:MAG: 50S ribosomal protein L22 [bacterium]
MSTNTAVAKANYLMISPFKLRRVANIVRKMPLNYAISILKSLPHTSAFHLLKVLNSAKANAKVINLNTDNLIIKELLVNEGPRHKRHRPRARGRMDMYKKRTSHIVVKVEEG